MTEKPDSTELIRALRLLADPSVRIVRQDISRNGAGPRVVAMKHGVSELSRTGDPASHHDLQKALDLGVNCSLLHEVWEKDETHDFSWLPPDLREEYYSWFDASISGGDQPSHHVGTISLRADAKSLLTQLDEATERVARAQPEGDGAVDGDEILAHELLVAHFWLSRYADRAWELMWEGTDIEDLLAPSERMLSTATAAPPHHEPLPRVIADIRARWRGATEYRATLPRDYDGEEIDRWGLNPDRQSFTDYLQPIIDDLRSSAKAVALRDAHEDSVVRDVPLADGSSAMEHARAGIVAARERLMQA